MKKQELVRISAMIPKDLYEFLLEERNRCQGSLAQIIRFTLQQVKNEKERKISEEETA